MTLHKFLSTNTTYRDVTNESAGGAPVRRTAWAAETNTWPTYLYFTIAVVSFFFNLGIMVGYLHSIRTANLAASVSSVFNTAVLLLNFVIWCVTAALYKQQSVVTKDGKHNDLWGWTCSPAAKIIQPAFHDQVNFDKYCTVQTASWFFGLLQIGATALSLVLYSMGIRRLQSKKLVRRTMTTQPM